MEKGNRATEAHHASEGGDRAPSCDAGHAFNDALIEHIEQAKARLARPGKLPEDRVRAIAHEVAVVLLLRSSADPPIPDGLERIIVSEIRKELRGLSRECELPAAVSHDDGRRRLLHGTHDPSRPILCPRLAAIAHQGPRVVEFLRLIRQGCAMLVDDRAFRGRRRGRKWKLDPAWLFRRAYLEERECRAIAAETGYPTLCIIEMLRRLSDRLQVLLLVVLAVPPAVVAAIVAGNPIPERVRDNIIEAVHAYVHGKETENPG